MILQCFENIVTQLNATVRVANVELLDKQVAESYIPTKAKFGVAVYYNGEDEFSYDESTSIMNDKVNGGVVFLNENLGNEKSNKESLAFLELIKTSLIGFAPASSADEIRITAVEVMDKIENFVRYRISFEFGI